MPKTRLTILEAELSVPSLAAALRIREEDVVAKFRDPRVTSWFAEIWGENLFGYRKHLSSNHPGSDAAVPLGPLGRFDISVRCFNTGNIKFQKSKFIGSGRGGCMTDLISSIEDVERVVVVDLRTFPKLRFVPLDTKPLLRLIREGKLTMAGLTPRRFDEWVDATFEVAVESVVLKP